MTRTRRSRSLALVIQVVGMICLGSALFNPVLNKGGSGWQFWFFVGCSVVAILGLGIYRLRLSGGFLGFAAAEAKWIFTPMLLAAVLSGAIWVVFLGIIFVDRM